MNINCEDKGMKMVVTLRDNALPVIEEYHDGVIIGKGTYTHEAYANAVLQSLDYDAIRTPVLPRNTIYYSEGPAKINLFFEIPAHSRRVYYHEAVIEDVSYPSLIFGVSLITRDEKKVVQGVFIAAIEEQFSISEETEMFCYPFTNVSASSHKVCWGTQKLPTIEKMSQLSSIPDLFFNTPNSDSYYSESINTRLTFRELMEEIKGKSFPEKYLKPIGQNLKEWIHEVTHSIY
ncbi:hypothetical protein JI735_34140 (plasmid) [Paenibacillus sonchi]|uniref:Uncharacterized protein n=1 Tax=Paenibacillus sonchi TaxID=373687 RepID=A0A974SFY3_9BACL|nr:hypothetical protein [Paenibacillus sonchi]QQZ64482.1 hypothetical protein JI735_34140 [Paenibacillus sonchi]